MTGSKPSNDLLRRDANVIAARYEPIVAFRTPTPGFAQVVAAGPELVRWWGAGTLRAVLRPSRHHRGARRPPCRCARTCHPRLPRAAAAGYLTDRNKRSPPDWLDHALAYATTELQGPPRPSPQSRLAWDGPPATSTNTPSAPDIPPTSPTPPGSPSFITTTTTTPHASPRPPDELPPVARTSRLR